MPLHRVYGNFFDPDVRGYVMNILYFLDRGRAFHFLANYLNDPDDYVRLGAVRLLGGYGEEITPLLIPLLENDPFPDVRCCAAAMLGYFGTGKQTQVLRRQWNTTMKLTSMKTVLVL